MMMWVLATLSMIASTTVFFGAITWYSTKRNIGSLQNVTLVYPKTEQRLNHKRNGGPPDHGTMALAERTIHHDGDVAFVKMGDFKIGKYREH